MLIDYNNVLFRSLFTHSNFYYNGIYTGGLFGVLNQLLSCSHVCNVDAIMVVQDAKPYIRSTYYEDYKNNRTPVKKDIKEKYIESSKLLDEFFDLIGVPIIKITGYEADDLMAMSVIGKIADEIIALSNDSDLYQLFKFKTPFYLYRGKDGIFDKTRLESTFKVKGIHNKWAEILAYSGGHNNLVGIRGVGIKTAIKILFEGKTIPLTRREKALIARNIYLTKLPIGYENNKIPWKEIYKFVRIMRDGVKNIDGVEKINVLKFFKQHGFDAFVGETDKLISFNRILKSEYGVN